MTDHPEGKIKKGMDRRALLTGAAIGAAGTAALAAGAAKVKELTRPYMTPAALPPGQDPKIAESFQDSRPASEEQPGAPKGAPNVVAIILDDVGFADLGCYGSEIRTPAMDAIAASGLTYANFRTCAMCSPTRAAFLTGLNHHSAGVGWLADIDAGYPGYRGNLTNQAMTLAEVLKEAGWSTFLTGKWHVNYAGTCGPNGPYDTWPTHRGFERAYWFQGHSTDFFKPSELFDGVAPIEPPVREGYYFDDDMTDRAIAYVRTQKALAPEKPFYLHVAFPGAHSPLQVPAEERDAYKGQYDVGWDVIRARRLEKQRTLGVVPETTVLPPLSFAANPWDSLSPVQKKVYARYMEVYAGMITRMDRNIGRLMAMLEQMGQRDNTIVVLLSDNGASAEGTETGTPNVFAPAFGRPVPVEEAEKLYDVMGTDATFPHYPIGWSNVSATPYRLYKQYTHLGGVADPLLISWPKGIAAKGEVRQQFVHVIDLFPTLLEAAKVTRPVSYQGRALKPVEGKSIVGTFASKTSPTRSEQYYELGGNRAYQEGNWRIAVRHERGKPLAEDKWELYDTAKDPNELNDIAAANPDVVARLKAKWDAAAKQFNVYPIDDRALVLKLVQDRQAKGIRGNWEFRPPIERIQRDVAPIVCGLNHEIEIEINRPTGAEDGVLLAHGSKHAGYALYVKDGVLIYEQSLVPYGEKISASRKLPAGKSVVRYVQKMTSRPFDGGGTLFINGAKVGEKTFERALFSTSYDGFSIGADLGNQVSSAYSDPNPFAGGIEVVRIKVDGSPTSPAETARFLEKMGLRV